MPQAIQLRPPVPEDGVAVYKLVKQCPPLDPNSTYWNLLQCSHFSSTSVAAIRNDELVGFISAYLIPEKPDTLFIWQVAVAESARGQGLATQMLDHLLQRESSQSVSFIETTITETNRASWALFESLAGRLDSALESQVMFDSKRHFAGEHETEMLVRVGPVHRR